MARPQHQTGGGLAEPPPIAGAVVSMGPDPVARPRVGRRVREIGRGSTTGAIALALIVLCTLAIVADASAGPSVLVSRSLEAFPGWEAGPLHYVTRRVILNPLTTGEVFTGVLAVMTVAYAFVLRAVRSLSTRTIVVAVIVLHAILLLSPPLLLTDLFNYLGYARLGAIHGLNPYAAGISHEHLDPVYRLTTWRNLLSPYGELFTALTDAVALLPLSMAFWVLKAVTVLLSLATLGLVWLCARRLGRDARHAVAFVALNPIFLVYAVGGFHNDFFMLVPSLAAIALVLSGRDRLAGASLVLAVAVKFTAILLVPFLLVAAGCRSRRRRLVEGAMLAAAPLIAGSLALFGASLPNLDQQSTLLTNQSVPNLVTWLTGLGGATPLVLKGADAVVVAVLAWHLMRRSHWLVGAGWTTFALILSFGWVVPWYVIWLLPLAALAPSVPLRRASAVLTVYLLIAFVPVTPVFLARQHINPLDSSAGRASRALESRLVH